MWPHKHYPSDTDQPGQDHKARDTRAHVPPYRLRSVHPGKSREYRWKNLATYDPERLPHRQNEYKGPIARVMRTHVPEPKPSQRKGRTSDNVGFAFILHRPRVQRATEKRVR